VEPPALRLLRSPPPGGEHIRAFNRQASAKQGDKDCLAVSSDRIASFSPAQDLVHKVIPKDIVGFKRK
jgi:hypothetical protein